MTTLKSSQKLQSFSCYQLPSTLEQSRVCFGQKSYSDLKKN